MLFCISSVLILIIAIVTVSLWNKAIKKKIHTIYP